MILHFMHSRISIVVFDLNKCEPVMVFDGANSPVKADTYNSHQVETETSLFSILTDPCAQQTADF